MRTTLLLACAALPLVGGAATACATGPSTRCAAPPRAPQAALPADLTPATRRAILDLESPDFAVRSRATETLVAMGDDAIPALVAVGDRRVVVHGKVEASVTRPVLEAVLEASKAEALERRLGEPSAFLRRAAARELGRRGRLDAVPALTERLGDSDPAVRSAAAAALARLAERFEGAKGLGTSAAAWRAWWSREGRAAAASAAAKPEGGGG
jgi:hypothetical protein